MPLTRYSLSQNDYSGERGTTSIQAPELTALNFAAQLALWATLVSRINAITDGALVAEQISLITQLAPDNETASQAEAQRENKWLVSYSDQDATVGGAPNQGYLKLFNCELPCANLSLIINPGTEVLYRRGESSTGTPVQNFVDAFEAFVKSPYGGTARIEKIEFVGRR